MALVVGYLPECNIRTHTTRDIPKEAVALS